MLKVEGLRYSNQMTGISKRCATPPKIYLYFVENGKRSYIDIYGFIKEYGNRRISEAYANAICTPLLDEEFSSVQDLISCIVTQIKNLNNHDKKK